MWLNLPVKDMVQTKNFFRALGFPFNEDFPGAENWACMLVGKAKTVVMFIPEKDFMGFTQTAIANTGLGSEILISLDAESAEEIDEKASLVEANGGKIFGKPNHIDGWMYGFGFEDPNGHRWNMVYMDWKNAKK